MVSLWTNVGVFCICWLCVDSLVYCWVSSMWTGAEVQRVSESRDVHGSGRGRAVSVWCRLLRRVPRTSSSRFMSSCRLPRLQNVTRRATELSLDCKRIPRSRLLFSEGRVACPYPCRRYILVRFLFVCSVLSVYDGCVPWMCSFLSFWCNFWCNYKTKTKIPEQLSELWEFIVLSCLL